MFDKHLKLEVKEIKNTRFLDTKDFYVEAYNLKHNVFCLGYRVVEKDKIKVNMKRAAEFGLKEGPMIGKLQKNKSVEFRGKRIYPSDVTYKTKGKVLGFISDTVLTDNCYVIARDANVLISEATHTSEDREKAREFKHFTSKEAAQVAKESNVKKLVLTHFSQRYKDAGILVEDAQKMFENTIAAEDFMEIRV